MRRSIAIREFDYLYPGAGGQLCDAAFKFLREQAISLDKGNAQYLVLSSRHGKECLQVRNYVGTLSTPDGTIIEILPKHSNDQLDLVESRQLLWKMIRVVHDIPWQSSTDGDLQTYKKPLPEILLARFLSSVGHLVHRGIRSDYQRKKDTRKFLKGRLELSRQLRLPPARATDFCIEYDQYTVNRPENRLIRLALDQVRRWHLGIANTRLAKELSIAFSNVKPSNDVAGDFIRWRKQRDMAHYQPVRPWLELILRSISPWAFSGSWHGISMLFPMEKLFESYVEKRLQKVLYPGFKLTPQASRQYLTQHKGRKMFQLCPDILVTQGVKNYTVMDTKWKLIDREASDGSRKYNLKQSDLYQLYAYGHKYLSGNGDLILIYPRHESFLKPLASFQYEESMRLWVVPFDLQTDSLILPEELKLNCFQSADFLDLL